MGPPVGLVVGELVGLVVGFVDGLAVGDLLERSHTI